MKGLPSGDVLGRLRGRYKGTSEPCRNYARVPGTSQKRPAPRDPDIMRRAEDFILGIVYDVESTGALGSGSKRRDDAEIGLSYLTRSGTMDCLRGRVAAQVRLRLGSA